MKVFNVIFVSIFLFKASFSQEKVPLLFPSDSIIEINDSVNQEPFLQLTINPISFWTGNYVKQGFANTMSLNLVDIKLRVGYKKINFDLTIVRSQQQPIIMYDELRQKNYGNGYNIFARISDIDLVFDYNFKSLEFFDIKKIKKYPISGKDSNIKYQIENLDSKGFYNFSVKSGISFQNYINPALISQSKAGTSITNNNFLIHYYDVEFFTSSNQIQFLLGFNINKYFRVNVSSKNLKGLKYSKLNVYSNLFYVLSEKLNFVLLKKFDHSTSDYDENNIDYYSCNAKEVVNKASSNKIGLNSGVNYQFSDKRNFLLYNLGFEINLNPWYKMSHKYDFYATDSYNSFSSSGTGSLIITSVYFGWKLGLTFCSKIN